jgi:hypothetical protein
MLAKSIGLPLSFVAFLLATNLASNVIGSGIPLLAGASAGWAVWSFFRHLDEQRLYELLNPAPVMWQIPLPIVWGIFKDVFDSSFVVIGNSGGLVAWKLHQEDPSRGLMTSMLDFEEILGGPAVSAAYQRTITVEIQLTPQSGGTLIKARYQAFSPACTQLIEQIIISTNKRLNEDWMQQNGIIAFATSSKGSL